MRRTFLNISTTLTLVLSLALAALWVRSHWTYDSFRLCATNTGEVTDLGIQSTMGELTFFSNHYPPGISGVQLGWNSLTLDASAEQTIANFAKVFPKKREAHFAGFGFFQTRTYNRYTVPHWFILLGLATLCALQVRSVLGMRRRNRIGLCRHCGYDLRETPDRCPECGALAGEPPHDPPMQRTATASSGAIR